MKAVRFHETGGAEVLRYEEIDQPAPGADQVRIKVAASAYNPADGGLRGGFLPMQVTLPHVPGYDVSGTVDALGSGVEGHEVGDSVIGFLPMLADGAAAEFVVAPADALVKAPSRIPLVDAAGLPSVALTAWQALFEATALSAGQRLLINGAGGPVGGYAVQLAKRAGAYVVATASPRSAEFVSVRGADEVIDRTATAVIDAVTAPVDVLLNLAPITAEDFADMVPLVRDGGTVVSTTPGIATPGDETRGVRAETVFLHADRSTLAGLVALVEEGELVVDIAERVALSNLPDLHRRGDMGEVHGKVLVIPPTA